MRPHLLLALLLTGCGGEETDAPVEATPSCLPGDVAVDGQCQPPGVPADACAPGFAPDGNAGCVPVLPPAPCPVATIALLGETSCRPVAECGEAPWGLVVVEPGAQYVDAGYAALDSDGSAARPWIRRLAVLGAAAAVAVYVGWRFAERSQDGGPSGNYLADRTVEVIHPTERAVAWDRIEWSGPAQATYRLRVRNAVDGEVILGPVEVRASSVMPLQAEDTAVWPKRIRIEVELKRADGSWSPAEPRESELLP